MSADVLNFKSDEAKNRLSSTVSSACVTKDGWLDSVHSRVIPNWDLKNDSYGLSSLVLGVDGWVQGNGSSTRHQRAAIDSPPAQHSLRKQPRGARRKQAEMGAVDHSCHCGMEYNKRV